MWLLLLPVVALGAAPSEIRQAQRRCARGDGAACLRASEHLGATTEAYGLAARACSLHHAPGCTHQGAQAEARLGPAPIPAKAFEVLVAYERGCELGSAEGCRAASRTAVAWQALLHLSEARRLALHDAGCRHEEAEACHHASVTRALSAPAPRGQPHEPGALHPEVHQRQAAILACYEGVHHTRIATYKSVVRIAAHGSVKEVRVNDAGPHAPCLAEAFEDVQLPSASSLVQWAFPIAVELGPSRRQVVTHTSTVRPTVSRTATSRAEIDAQLDRAQVQACFQEAAVRRSTPGGTMRVHFTIGPTGVVHTARVVSTDLPAAHVDRCVLDIIRGLRFPAPAEGATIRVDHDIHFRPW